MGAASKNVPGGSGKVSGIVAVVHPGSTFSTETSPKTVAGSISAWLSGSLRARSNTTGRFSIVDRMAEASVAYACTVLPSGRVMQSGANAPGTGDVSYRALNSSIAGHFLAVAMRPFDSRSA